MTHATDTAADRCARCDCEGAHDQQALLAELRAQVEELRRERDTAREDARLLGGVLGHYTTIPRSRMAVLLWRSVRGRQAQRGRDALLRGLEAMRADGLDIDDLATAPKWTGKVLAGGEVVFDAAVASAEQAEAACAVMREALEHARCALAHVTPSGHDGDEDSAQCDEDCALCDVQSASAHLDAALATDAGKEMLAALVELRARMEPATRAGEALLTRLEELETLLRRIVTYAREDRASTPGATRLARALVEAERLLGREP